MVKQNWRQTLTYAVLGLLAFSLLLSLFQDYVLDDAYITYRFSKNLASAKGLTWNPGEPPIEGYTSFLWVAVNALGIKSGFNPVLFSRVIAILAAYLVIIIVILKSRFLPALYTLGLVSSIALSPAAAILVMEGMETSLASLLCLLLGMTALTATERVTRSVAFLSNLVAFLLVLTRPDAIMFSAPVLATMCLRLYHQRRFSELRSLLICGLFFSGLGIGYIAWRVWYFGAWFPTSAHLKFGIGHLYGVKYLGSFVLRVALPLLLLPLLLGIKRVSMGTLYRLLPLLTGVCAFATFLLMINPIQGGFWRFVFPVYPVSIFTLIELINPERRPWLSSRWRGAVFLAIVAVWNLSLIPASLTHKEFTHQSTRVAIGRELNGIDGVMLTTASGAIPYFSGWKSADTMGLTSSAIAHDGLKEEHLLDLHPDLIIMVSNHEDGQSFGPKRPALVTITQYMIDQNYSAVAAIERTNGIYLYFFVDTRSELFPELVQRILSIDGLHYGNLDQLIKDKRLSIHHPDGSDDHHPPSAP